MPRIHLTTHQTLQSLLGSQNANKAQPTYTSHFLKRLCEGPSPSSVFWHRYQQLQKASTTKQTARFNIHARHSSHKDLTYQITPQNKFLLYSFHHCQQSHTPNESHTPFNSSSSRLYERQQGLPFAVNFYAVSNKINHKYP